MPHDGKFPNAIQSQDSRTCLFSCSLSPSRSQSVPPPAAAAGEV